jgi:epoxyqueuosine reductase
MNLTERIKAHAIELGFDLVGVVPAGVAPHIKEYADWVAAGMMGEMAYMARDPERRSNLDRVLAGAKSVIVVGLSYYTIDLPDDVKHDPSRGLIARYAWGVDYHEVMTPRLEELAQFVREESPHPPAHSPKIKKPISEEGERNLPSPDERLYSSGEGPGVRSKVYVDTGPVLERDWAQLAGLGFVGKNTCVINPRMGSWLFLGVIITEADLAEGETLTPAPAPSPRPSPIPYLRSGGTAGRGRGGVGCGRCTRCLTACPTNAFPAPYVLDARKCISYLTIELKGSIPLELRPLMGNHIFGCDICQDVCPWPTRFAIPTQERSFYPIDLDRAAPKLIDLAQLNEEDFKQRFAGTPLLRSKRRGLLRNVAVALGNWGSVEAREALQLLARDSDPVIAEHARWGLANG